MENGGFDSLERFPTVRDGDIDVVDFLTASKRMTLLINDLGILFAPLASDMTNNIGKIEQGASQIGNGNSTIQKLLLDERQRDKKIIFESLVWLTRSLKFLLTFFRGLIEDKDANEDLKHCMTIAYQNSLEPHHGWLTRQLFTFFKNVCPSRTVTIGILAKRLGNTDVVTELCIFSDHLELNLNYLDELFKLNGFHCDLIVS